MTLEEYLEKSDRKGLEALMLWCVKELHGEDSWVYDAYSQKIEKSSNDELKTMIESYISNRLLPPSVVKDIIDVYAELFCTH